MSDLNDDLLNYDIGDVDDNDLIGAEDEDELLLSDDDSIPLKISQEQEKDLLGEEDLDNDDDLDNDVNQADSTPSVVSTPNTPPVQEEKTNSIVEHVEPIKTSPATRASLRRAAAASCTAALPKTPPATKASLTKKHIETPQSSCSDTSDLVKIQESSSTDDPRSQTESDVESVTTASHTDSLERTPTTTISDMGSESTPIHQSQETQSSSQMTPDEISFELEDDSDELNERTNPKTCIERAIEPPVATSGPESGRPPYQPVFNRQQGGPFSNRGHYPAPYHPYRTPGNENFNPQFPPQFRPPPNHMRPGGRPMLPAFGPGAGGPMHPYRMPPAHTGMPHPRLPLPHPNQLPPGASRPPYGIYPNAGGPMPLRGGSPPFGAAGTHRFPPGPGFPPRARPPPGGNMLMHPAQRPPQLQPHAMPVNVIGVTPLPQPQLPKIARKVLINPNFKGGVQAATNQLMKDTMANAQYLAANSDAELLRQQEAFINQNRMHIEKRRRSRDRSRERSVDRDRGRSYSPPPPNRRRPYDRDNRRPYNEPRGGNDNRGRSDTDNRGGPRRHGSADRDVPAKKPNEDEDEETRAYRLKIEKQKAMREKLIRDKEQRRRKAAEKIKSVDEVVNKPTEEPLNEKLTPIVVTTKKIISLKKKSADQTTQSSSTDEPAASASPPSKPIRQLMTGRKIPTATIHPETKGATATAVVKPVLKRTQPAAKLQSDDEFDEDELLADTPPSSPVRVAMKPVAKVVASSSAGLLSNRRVIIRSEAGSDAPVGSRKLNTTKTRGNATAAASDDGDREIIGAQHKGIFDRLDKKSIGINSAAKRKIARIVINNSE